MVSPAFAGEEERWLRLWGKAKLKSWMNAKAVDAKCVAELVQVAEHFGGINGQAGRQGTLVVDFPVLKGPLQA